MYDWNILSPSLAPFDAAQSFGASLAQEFHRHLHTTYKTAISFGVGWGVERRGVSCRDFAQFMNLRCVDKIID
jgi:hypothetical protein